VADIEEHPALSALPKPGINFPRFEQFVAKTGKDMGIDIARVTRPNVIDFRLGLRLHARN
jgi:hypothetical protein